MKKKILVTGGSGFIGSHFIELLINKKYKVTNIDIKKNIFFEKLIDKKFYKFERLDICSKKKIEKLLKKNKFKYIVNFAAESHVDKSIDGPKKFFDTNVIGTLNLLENIRKLNYQARFVQISTDEVFGDLKPNEKPFTIENNFKPNSPYSASKAAADHLIRSYFKTYGINVSSCHSSNNFGERQNPEKLIPMILTSLISNKKIPIYGNGKNIRDWIYVKENCRAVYQIMKNGIPGKNYLIGGSNEINNLNLVKKVIETYSNCSNQKLSFEKNVIFVKDRLGHDFRYSVDISELQKTFKFKFRNNFNYYLRKTILHYIKFYKYYKSLAIENKWFLKKYEKYKKN